MKQSLRIVGCRAGSPLHNQPASGSILRTERGSVLFDCGPGVLVNLTDEEVANLQAVVITHRHADHCLDLMALAYRLLFPAPKKPLPLIGPPSLQAMIDGYDALFGIPSLPTLHRPISTAFTFTPVTPGQEFVIKGFGKFATCLMHHPIETMAVKSLDYRFAITADGAYTDVLQTFCNGCDLLVSEATYPDGNGRHIEAHGHMTAMQCAQLAELANVQRLVVSHLSDPADSENTMKIVTQYFSKEAVLGVPGLTFGC